MAQAPHHAGDGADFVRRIVADPKNVPDVMLLYGYLGASSEEGHERLYLSPDLSNFVEVPEKAILHRVQAAKEQDPHGGMTLWVKKDAKLSYKMAPAQQAAQQALAHYFAGAIQAGAPGMAAAAPIPPQTLPQALCPPQTIIPAACPISQVDPCPTRFATCHVTCAPNCTHVAPCPTFYQTCPGLGTCAPACPTHLPEATCAPLCTHAAPCPTFVATCPPNASCAPNCTHVAPCPTFVATCPPHATCAPGCPTHHVTCAPPCTQITPCVTRGQPDCPFPTEICTHIPAQCTHLPNCVLPQAAMMGGAAAAPAIHSPLVVCRQSVLVECSVACPTRFTCIPQCWVTRYASCATCAPECWVTRYATCHVTCNPEICWITRACPVETAACPSLACPSLACGSLGCGVQGQM